MNAPDPSRLTRQGRVILGYIAAYVTEHGYPPSVREIGAHIGMSSTSSVHHHLTLLERSGFLVRDRSRPRAIRVIAPPPEGTTP